MPKTMSLRLDDDQATLLELVARADNESLTATVRTAIEDHIERRRQDSDFMQRIAAQRERDRELYDRLAN